MESNLLCNEITNIYKNILENNQITEESYQELLNFFQTWENDENFIYDHYLNYLILNLIDYLSTLPSATPSLQVYIKKIKILIFKCVTDNLLEIENKFIVKREKNFPKKEIFYENEEGVIIYNYYTPSLNNNFLLPPYGKKSSLKISGTLKNGKKYFQKVLINHQGRVLELDGDWYEDIDFSQEKSEEDYDKLFNEMVKNILNTNND